MRKSVVVLTALMIALAGCGGGGGGGTASPADPAGEETTDDGPSMEDTPTPDDDDDPETTPTPDDDDDESEIEANVSDAVSSFNSSDPFGNATELEVTLYNGSEQTSVLFQNDTSAERELLQVNAPNRGTTTLYTTNDYVALRNTTTGDVQYGEPDSRIGTPVSFSAAFLALGGFIYVGIVEWEEGGTTTVDGETAYVYEANSLNETAFEGDENVEYQFDQGNIQSVDGRMVITSDGFQSISVQLESPQGTFGSEMSFTYGDISIPKPDWVDESQAP